MIPVLHPPRGERRGGIEDEVSLDPGKDRGGTEVVPLDDSSSKRGGTGGVAPVGPDSDREGPGVVPRDPGSDKGGTGVVPLDPGAAPQTPGEIFVGSERRPERG